MLSSVTYETIIHYVQIGFDILLMWVILYFLIKVVRTNKKTIQLFQGVILIIIVQLISKYLGLKTVYWLANNIVSWGVIAIIVIFQPEIRQILERLGKSNAFARISTLTSGEKESLIDELLNATASLSNSKTGALISLEQANSLSEYIRTGISINSIVSAELICSIFVNTTPLHDGAVIIQGDKLACASAYFPPTTMDLPAKYGARHRAAIGISEVTDAVTIVVSEESGRVAVAQQGKLTQMNEQKLRDFLEKIILNKENIAGQIETPINKSVSVDSLANEADIDYKQTSVSVNYGTNELDNISGHEMKAFQTYNFKTVNEPTPNTSNHKIVEEVINNSINGDKLSDSITIRQVKVPKDNITRDVTEIQGVIIPSKTKEVRRNGEK